MEIGGELRNDVLEKLYRFLSYQERCTQEVVDKLFKLKISSHYHQEYIRHLKEENFLNDERYVEVFVRSKIKGNKWGKRKVQQALQYKKIDHQLIAKGLKSFQQETYQQIANELALKKFNSIQEEDVFKRKQKVYNYLAQKGFESPIIQTSLQTLN